jgi:uncharacterized protein (DUF1810 family)
MDVRYEKYDLNRFKAEHQRSFERALEEIKSGRKRTHWMWYIFPQISGLGSSYMSTFFAIKDLDEARAFIGDEYLGGNLREISNALVALENNDARYVMGQPDNRKLRSCMTLFLHATDDNEVFLAVLDKFFGGEEDEATLEILGIK